MSLLDPKLEAFFTIAQVGTVNGAAERLKITQTGVTQRIRALERQLSTTLFIRSRSGMKLSYEGEALFRYCQSALELEGQVMSYIDGSNQETKVSLTIAGPTSIMSSRVIPHCGSIYEQYPQLLLNYRLDDRENRSELLKKGEVQLAILSPEMVTLEMDSKMLKPDKYVLVASAKWKNRKLKDIIQSERIIDFYESDETTFKYLRKFKLMDIARKERIFANDNSAVINLFKAGIGYGTLTAEVAASSVEKGDLILIDGKHLLEDPLALAWYPRGEMPAYFRSIVQAIK